MGIQDGTTTYKLKRKCDITTSKGLEHLAHVVLREPTAQHTKYYMKLRQMINKAQLDAAAWAKQNISLLEDSVGIKESIDDIVAAKELANVSDAEYDKNIDGDDDLILQCITNSERVELDEFVAVFEKMILADTNQSIASCNGDIRLKLGHWQKIHPDDQLGMACRWCSFFVMPPTTEQ
jgi:hypothetical protein